MLAVLLWWYSEQLNKAERNEARRKEILKILILLRLRMQQKSRSYLTSSCLLPNHQTEWHHLLLHGSDKNLINAISLPRDAFYHLANRFSKNHTARSGPGKVADRPKLCNHILRWACYLHFTQTAWD